MPLTHSVCLCILEIHGKRDDVFHTSDFNTSLSALPGFKQQRRRQLQLKSIWEGAAMMISIPCSFDSNTL